MKISHKVPIRKARIEMLPLIDVVFLILVFFILAFLSMTVHKGIPLNLPQSGTALVDTEDYLSISVSPIGTYFLNKDPISFEELELKLQKVYGTHPDRKIYIAGDENAKYGAVIKVFDRIREIGFEKVLVETEGQVK